jgi:hypothetical protein
MRQREQRTGGAKGGQPGAGPIVEAKLWRAAAAGDLDAFPEHTARMSGSQGLHGRLFRREPCGKRGCRVALGPAVRYLSRGKDAVDEPLAVPLDSVRDAIDVGGVDAGANDVQNGNLRIYEFTDLRIYELRATDFDVSPVPVLIPVCQLSTQIPQFVNP